MTSTHVPVEHFNAELCKIGRSLDDYAEMRMVWQGEEFGLHVTWPDGFGSFVGFGQEASAVLEGLSAVKH
jgi:hypothetical protein